MANKKITELTELPVAGQNDVLPIVDVAGPETKKIKVSALKSSLNLTRADVGLSNVDNTSDANKPVSIATQTALNLKADETDLQNHINDTANPHAVTKAQVGLDQVNNTSDANKPVSNATQTALDLKANSADVYTKQEIDQKIKRVKRSITIQLDTPSPNPIIAPGASHTYVINLGQEFERLVLTEFQWVDPSTNSQIPDTVLGSASFPKNTYGGCLIVNKSSGGWVRNFEIDSSEFQSGLPSDVDAVFGSDSSDVDAVLGYGSSPLQVPLDHTTLESNPPKKLQIEDVYLEGTNLKVTIKNYDSVSIDLSPYVGITALFDENRTTDFGTVSENGVIAYMGSDNPFLRLSENSGKTFNTIHIPKNTPSDSDTGSRRIVSMSLTNDGANTFLAMFNYNYILTAQSPDYTVTQKINLKTSMPSQYQFSFTQYGGIYGGDTFRLLGKQLDYKKTSSESCMLFSGFMNYYSMSIFKSVDDGASFGSNAPSYNDGGYIFTAGQTPVGTPNNNVPDYKGAGDEKYQKCEPKAIDVNTHFVSMSYSSTPELINNGFPTPNVYLGEQTFDSGVQTRAGEACFTMPTIFNSGLGTIKVVNSVDNNGLHYSFNETKPQIPVYYLGSQTVGAESVEILASEYVVLLSDFDSQAALIGDVVTTNYASPARILGLRNLVIDGVDYKGVSLGLINQGSGNAPFSYSGESNGGSPIFGAFFQALVSFRNIIHNGTDYFIYPTTSTFSPDDFISNPSIQLNFVTNSELQKSIVMKTTDGGSTWNSICEHDELRYSPAHVFWSSTNGQNLMLAVMKYHNSPAYEKWAYPYNTSELGSDMRFNMSVDGGATWVNPTGSWVELGKNGLNPYGQQRQVGQLLGKIENEILAITLDPSGAPVLRRSTDNGLSFGSPIQLKAGNSAGQNAYRVIHNDSKEQFMGFFGNLYQTTGDKVMLYYGSTVDKYTQWKAYGEK